MYPWTVGPSQTFFSKVAICGSVHVALKRPCHDALQCSSAAYATPLPLCQQIWRHSHEKLQLPASLSHPGFHVLACEAIRDLGLTLCRADKAGAQAGCCFPVKWDMDALLGSSPEVSGRKLRG